MANKKKWSGSIGVKLTVVLMILAIVCINFLGIVSFQTASSAIEKQVFNQVSAIGKLKTKQVSSFLQRKYRDVDVLAKSQNVIDSYKKLKQYHDKGKAKPNGPFDTASAEYSGLFNEMDPFFRQFQEAYNFSNLYFICAPSWPCNVLCFERQ